MNTNEIRAYCLGKAGAFEDFPFGDDVLVMKVGSKMFAILAEHEDGPRISLKCDPMLALSLREQYASVKPGYHLNKQHWNTIHVDGSIQREKLEEWIDLSYDLVYKTLKKSEKEKIR